MASTGLAVPLTFRNYRLALGGRFCSLSAEFMQWTTLSILFLDIVRTPSGWAYALVIQAIPRALLMLFTGVAVDKFGSKRVMIASNVLQIAGLVSLMGWILATDVRLEYLYLYMIVLGVALALFVPASGSMVPDLLPRDQVRNGTAIWLLGFNIAATAGPPVAAALLGLGGGGVALAGAAGALVVGTTVLLAVSGITSRHVQTPGIARQIREGIAAARRDGAVWMTVVTAPLYNIGYLGATFVGIPSMAKLALDAGDAGVGTLYAALGCGSLCSILAMALVARIGRQAVAGCVFLLAMGALLVAVSAASSLWIAAALLFVSGICQGIGAVIFLALVQTRTPVEVRGRVMSVFAQAQYLLTPLAYGLGGVVGDILGPRGVVAVGGVAVLLTGTILLASRAIRNAD